MEVFFYGLFMDTNILEKNGIQPSNERRGYLNDYTLKIGNRASLIPCKHERAYGLVMTVDKAAILELYAEASVADYIAEEVNIVVDGDETLKAICYNLPVEAMTGTNASYAQSLYALAKKLDFPESYLRKIEEMARPS